MATVPSPKTWVALEDVTAAEMNLELRDAINFLLSPPRVWAYRTALLTLTNNVDPEGLTSYVASTFQPNVPYGTNESIVYLYGTQGAKITSMKVNGVSGFSIQAGTELGRPVQAAYLTIPPGKSQTVTWELEEPSAPGEATVPVQPLVVTEGATGLRLFSD